MTETPFDPVAYTRDLIRCPSVTPDEGGAISYLARVLSEAGFEVHRPVFTEADTPDIENLFAAIGSGAKHFCFAGHTDVVPPGNEADWVHAPFSGKIVDGKLFGRGAADMKGGVAAFLAATQQFLAETGPRFDGRISFLITGDEEGPAINGTVKLLEWAAERGEKFSACIVGEPTNPEAMGDMIKLGRRGSQSGTLTIHGKQGHVAYPHLTDNPVRALPAFLEALMAPPLDTGSARFQPSNLEVTSVETGNRAVNVIPAVVSARFNVRFNDLWTPETLREELRRRCAAAAKATPLRGERNEIAFTLEFAPLGAEVFLTEQPELVDTLSAAIAGVTGRQPKLSTSGGTSDARFIKNYCPVVDFGLVGKTMHQTDEHAAVADILALTAIYKAFLHAYFGF